MEKELKEMTVRELLELKARLFQQAHGKGLLASTPYGKRARGAMDINVDKSMLGLKKIQEQRSTIAPAEEQGITWFPLL